MSLLQPLLVIAFQNSEKVDYNHFASIIVALMEVQIFGRVCLAFWTCFSLPASWREVGG